MAYLSQLRQRLEALDINEVVTQTLEQSTDAMAEYNQAQMYGGKTKTGAFIEPEYKPFTMPDGRQYADYKYDRNPLPGYGVPDLYDTGSFYKNTFAEITGDSIVIDSTDSKADDLKRKYGEDIFGLGGEYKAALIEDELQPALMNNLRNGLKL